MIECVNFKKYEKNTLKGFADFKLPDLGIEIFGCALHEKGNRRWVNLPAKEFQNDQNETKYMPIMKFIEKEAYDQFVVKALDAIDKYQPQEQELPF